MDYRLMWKEDNELIRERYELAIARIGEFWKEETVEEPFRSYFLQMAAFADQLAQLAKLQLDGKLRQYSLEQLKELNHTLYADILPEHYRESYANPGYAAAELGEAYGPLLAAFYAQMRGGIVFAYESRLTDLTILMETLIELYNLFEDQTPEPKSVKEVLYWFHSDYTDITFTYRLREQMDPQLSFATDIIMDSDLSDLCYLYRFGEYISENELEIAGYLNTLPQETIDRMAHTYTEGYRKGFEVMGRDLSIKKTVGIRYELGFERMIRAAVHQFREMGLEPVIYRAAVWSVTVVPNRKIGYHGTAANKQYDYDHRYDQAIYFDKAFKDRKLGVLKTAYEEYKELARGYAGPAVVETFGEEGFQPVNCPQAFGLSEKQEQYTIAYSNESMPIVNEYIPGEETSFTIIAFPVPAIGEKYEEIFAETIRINTLDYEIYKEIQQQIIDVLDQGYAVHVTGRGDNETDITVQLHPIRDPEKETNFENCVADVNIPVGEVFTSPILTGTTGLLHVGKVYLGDIQFRNLKLWFEDGKIREYSCENFEDPKEGQALIRQEILKNHDTLPMGEFAIGTNTVAYAVAEQYQIQDKFPILIAEKTGPHFAVGDTCYSWSEDQPMYNPNGKEVIARDNEISLLRREDVSKAYFGCHTDITIPYKELRDIEVLCAGGRRLPVISQGRFVVPGTEKLNEELDKVKL